MLNEEVRRGGVTGSGVAEVLGMNPWRGPWHFWARWHGLVAPVEQTERMRYGKIVERSILTMAAQDLPGLVCELNGAQAPSNIVGLGDEVEERTFISDQKPLCRATPDGWWYELDDGALLPENPKMVALGEAKNVGIDSAGGWEKPDEVPDGVPAYVYAQVQWGLEAMGLRTSEAYAIVAASIGGTPPRIYRLPFDGEFIALAYGVIEEFWNKHILTGEPPPVDPKDSRARSWLKEFYRDQSKQELVALDGAMARQAMSAVEARERAKAAIKQWEEYQERAEAVLRDLIREWEGVEGPGFQATYRQTKSGTKTDWKGICAKLLPLAKDPKALVAEHTTTKAGHRQLLTKLLEVSDG
uniref:Putative exonuclease n=1 Tax=viral metagenome TaxID=1070528 RepID=A0A6M3XR23_9ZZZZ